MFDVADVTVHSCVIAAARVRVYFGTEIVRRTTRRRTRRPVRTSRRRRAVTLRLRRVTVSLSSRGVGTHDCDAATGVATVAAPLRDAQHVAWQRADADDVRAVDGPGHRRGRAQVRVAPAAQRALDDRLNAGGVEARSARVDVEADAAGRADRGRDRVAAVCGTGSAREQARGVLRRRQARASAMTTTLTLQAHQRR